MEKKWHLLEIKKEVIEKLDFKQQLNSQFVSDLILEPILKIKDLRTDQRVEFMSGELPIQNLMSKVKSTPNSVGICLYPHDVEEIIKIADLSETMPPKSTWIEPKLRSAITIYEY
jgi:uncharacterized protein (DUF1015 family)